MSLKGIGSVEEGVKKITGISIASAGQLIVRGLGDRYSTTTLNGLPIASPNPDNKLVPLDCSPRPPYRTSLSVKCMTQPPLPTTAVRTSTSAPKKTYRKISSN